MDAIERFIGSVDDLPSLPALVDELLEAGSGRGDNFARMAGLVEKDLGLSARVLRIANAPYYARGQRVSSVTMAIARMGMQEFRRVAFSVAVMNNFRDLEARIDMDAFWAHCLASALACRLVASPAGADADGAGESPHYMAGLLHHVGILVEAMKEPLGFAEARAFALDQGWPMAEAERRILGYDHAEIGAALLERWGLPEDVSDAARWHLRPDQAVRNRRAAQVLHLAGMLCHELDPEVDSFEGVAPVLSEEAFFDLGWNEERLPILVESLGGCLRRAREFREAVAA